MPAGQHFAIRVIQTCVCLCRIYYKWTIALEKICPPQLELGDTCQMPSVFQLTTDWGYRLTLCLPLFLSPCRCFCCHFLIYHFSPFHIDCNIRVNRWIVVSSASYVNLYKLLIYCFYRYKNELRVTQCHTISLPHYTVFLFGICDNIFYSFHWCFFECGIATAWT